MYYPTLQNIESIIKQMNKRYNMNVVIINKGQLEFALEKPKTKLFGNEQYPELYQKAAALMEIITKSHTLSDGNKRTAMMAAEFMIKANGGELVLPLKAIRLSVDTAMDETDSMSQLIQQWFKVHIAMNVHQLCAILYEYIEEETIIKKLWDDQKYDDVEKLIGKWMAFDSYPENKKAWDELTKQWQDNQTTINKKSSIKSSEFGWSQMWGSIMGMAKRDHEEYGDYFTIPVEKISDLRCYENSMEELVKMENMLNKYAKAYETTTEPDVIHQNGMILERHRNYSESIEQFEKLRKFDKDESDAVSHIALILQYRYEDPKSALEYWKIFEKYHPDSSFGAKHIGLCMTDLEQYSDGLKYFEKIKDDTDPETILFKGICNEELGNYETAIQCYEKTISLKSREIDAYGRLATTYSSMDQMDKALEIFEKIIELQPNDFRIYYNRGIVFHEHHRFDEAMKEYEKALELNPNDLQTIVNMGSALSDSGNREKAIEYFQKALKQDPNHEIALSSLGLTLLHLKRYDEALIPLDFVLKSNPDYIHPKITKAMILVNTGKILESLTLLEEIVSKEPGVKEILKHDVDGMFVPIKDSERYLKLIQ